MSDQSDSDLKGSDPNPTLFCCAALDLKPSKTPESKRRPRFPSLCSRSCAASPPMSFRNVKVPNVPGGARAAGTLVKLAVVGGVAVYGALNSLYNVEGGHRAIVFNRLQGIKDKVFFEIPFHFFFFGLLIL